MNFLGKLIYVVSYPFILLIIRNSHRVYGAIVYKDKILVTKNYLGFQNTWRLPGGGLKKNEPELSGLIREVKEEVGILLPADKLSLVVSGKKHRKHFYYSIYVCKLQQQPKIDINNSEILDAQFISINNLLKGPKVSESLELAIKSLTSP